MRLGATNLLEIRPNCELCDCDLPADSSKAMICTYECTYCSDCVTGPLENVCPTCGGGLTQRPIRPKQNWRDGKSLGLEFHPASDKRYHSPYSEEDLQAHTDRIKDIPVEKR